MLIDDYWFCMVVFVLATGGVAIFMVISISRIKYLLLLIIMSAIILIPSMFPGGAASAAVKVVYPELDAKRWDNVNGNPIYFTKLGEYLNNTVIQNAFVNDEKKLTAAVPEFKKEVDTVGKQYLIGHEEVPLDVSGVELTKGYDYAFNYFATLSDGTEPFRSLETNKDIGTELDPAALSSSSLLRQISNDSGKSVKEDDAYFYIYIDIEIPGLIKRKDKVKFVRDTTITTNNKLGTYFYTQDLTQGLDIYYPFYFFVDNSIIIYTAMMSTGDGFLRFNSEVSSIDMESLGEYNLKLYFKESPGTRDIINYKETKESNSVTIGGAKDGNYSIIEKKPIYETRYYYTAGYFLENNKFSFDHAYLPVIELDGSNVPEEYRDNVGFDFVLLSKSSGEILGQYSVSWDMTEYSDKYYYAVSSRAFTLLDSVFKNETDTSYFLSADIAMQLVYADFVVDYVTSLDDLEKVTIDVPNPAEYMRVYYLSQLNMLNPEFESNANWFDRLVYKWFGNIWDSAKNTEGDWSVWDAIKDSIKAGGKTIVDTVTGSDIFNPNKELVQKFLVGLALIVGLVVVLKIIKK